MTDAFAFDTLDDRETVAAPKRERRRGARIGEFDWALALTVALLIALSLVMVSSASLAIADRSFGAPLHYLVRHGIAIGLALTVALAAYMVPVRWWERSGTLLFFIGIVLLILVLVPGIGRTVNGATRWIPLGPISLQSSELMKFFALVYVAGYLVRRQEEVATRLTGFIKPMFLMAIASILILAEPDFGTAAVLLATVLGMLFLGGVRMIHFVTLMGLVGGAMAMLIVVEPYRLQRLTSFLNPFADPYGSGFQLTQALIAFGRGEWIGVGLGNGIQKQFYLPEAHTDFLLAVIGEELGLVGTLAVVGAFTFIVWRAFRIGERAREAGDLFACFLAHGIGLVIALQALINIGVNVGLLPTKGLTLPFMSYGSNSMLVACISIAVLLRIDREHRRREAADGPLGRRRWHRV